VSVTNSPTLKWERVKRGRPCGVCKREDGLCAASTDGQFRACYREGGPEAEEKTNKSGLPFWLHRLNGRVDHDGGAAKTAHKPSPARAHPDDLQAVYSALLADPRLALTKAHLADLARRGFPEEEARRRGYASIPIRGREEIAFDLAHRFGKETLLSVPGFIVNGRDQLDIASFPGLVIPSRDLEGRVIALIVRPDKPPDPTHKYLYVSSVNRGGPSPGAPAHIPLGVAGPVEVLRLTEGPLKADLATILTGEPTIAAPGVTNWRPCVRALKTFKAKVVRLAFDGDWRVNGKVAQATVACVEGLKAEGIRVEFETWNPGDGKGIDDILAVGKTPTLLTGCAADAHLHEVEKVAYPEGRPASARAATNKEDVSPPDDKSVLDRLAEHVANKDAAAILRDVPFLVDLARMKAASPSAFSAILAELKKAKIPGFSSRDFESAVKEHKPSSHPGEMGENRGIYYIKDGRFFVMGDEHLEVLSEFTAKIVEEVVRDDGVESKRRLVLKGELPDGRPLSAEIGAAEFSKMEWVTPSFGSEAIVTAGPGKRDHVRAAVQYFSDEKTIRTVYLQTGWRDIGGENAYLSRSGAIKASGLDRSVSVELPGLNDYDLPEPPQGERRIAAVRASLRMLDLAKSDRPMSKAVAGTLFAAAYRAAIGHANFTIQAYGLSGSLKTSTTVLPQQAFGCRMNLRNGPPATWKSTPGFNEHLMFTASDAILLIDDLVPVGSSQDINRIHGEAARIFQAQGNGRSRDRLNSDGTPKPGKPPRGLVISTGEDRIRADSANMRSIPLPFVKGDKPKGIQGTIDEVILGRCQADADAGLYAESMSAYLQWLAPQLDAVREEMPGLILEYRKIATRPGDHGRTPDIVADLFIGARTFLRFAREIGAITNTESEGFRKLIWDGLMEAAAEAKSGDTDADAGEMFIRLIVAALASRQCFLEDMTGSVPVGMEAAAGWNEEYKWEGSHQQLFWVHGPNAQRLGWTDGTNIYFEPTLAYQAVQNFAKQQGQAFPVGREMLYKLLNDSKKIVEIDRRTDKKRYTTRKTIQKKQISILMMSCSDFWGEPGAETNDASVPFQREAI